VNIANRLSLSVACGVVSAVVGWFTAGLIGMLAMRFIGPGDTGLGLGVLMAALLYLLAFLFGVAGFVLCLWSLSKRHRAAFR